MLTLNSHLRCPFVEDNSGLPERTNESAGSYAKACLAVASDSQVFAVDIWTKMQQFPGWHKACLRYSLHIIQCSLQIRLSPMLHYSLKENLKIIFQDVYSQLSFVHIMSTASCRRMLLPHENLFWHSFLSPRDTDHSENVFIWLTPHFDQF